MLSSLATLVTNFNLDLEKLTITDKGTVYSYLAIKCVLHMH